MAHTLKELGHEVMLLLEEDFYMSSDSTSLYKVYKFSASAENYYLSNFCLQEHFWFDLSTCDHMFMRIDPPYDSRYQRYLWMLDYLSQKFEFALHNNPVGIMKNNEKILALKQSHSVPSYIGTDFESALKFVNKLNTSELIVKPLDLFSGIGVEKLSTHDFTHELVKERVEKFKGPIMIQPFLDEVYKGEARAIYCGQTFLGSFLKVPSKDSFLTNIAQGASFHHHEMNDHLTRLCTEISQKLYQEGVDLVAFDLLGAYVTEVNVTCPGLMVEMSHHLKRNVCLDYFNKILLD